MVEARQDFAASSAFWPTFGDQQTIAGIKLFELVDWVNASDRALAGGTKPEGMPLLAMPPMQRTAVWRPKQVVDL